MALDCDRRVAQLQVRIAVLNYFTALGASVTAPVAQDPPGKVELWSEPDLCNKIEVHQPALLPAGTSLC